MKQTVLMCYKQEDQQALDLAQVNAHGIIAFSASKAFNGGSQLTKSCILVTGRHITPLQIFI